ncbi:uncharacterized protein [Diadema antillarum]|uniref:uncharacterized protein n=1 Tax=Diadema antillarum TaxID=105358 RepID=UPI003A8871F2
MERMRFLILTCVLALLRNRGEVCAQTRPNTGLGFIGRGYDLLSGNPEGGDEGGTDPGIKGNPIFQLTYPGGVRYPRELSFHTTDRPYVTSSRGTFHGYPSYAAKLASNIEIIGSNSGVFQDLMFVDSYLYESFASRFRTRGSVYYYTETSSRVGYARYKTEVASGNDYELERDFVLAALRLPTSYDPNNYSHNRFMSFFDTWGTHVIIGAEFGTRTGTIREATPSEFVQYAASEMPTSLSAVNDTLTVDIEEFNHNLEHEMSFGSEYSTYVVGAEDISAEPIKLTLMLMSEVFKYDYWYGLNTYSERHFNWLIPSVRTAMLAALQNYPAYRQIQLIREAPISIDLSWPEGTYGLPKARDGCPNSAIRFSEGRRRHDTENSNNANEWSDPLHLAGSVSHENIEQQFCIKTVAEMSDDPWIFQPGTYCIYKRGDCPSGFTEGSIFWDDEDDQNSNSRRGVLPDGNYDTNTRLEYCCRNDGRPTSAIYLPTRDNFFLFPRFDHCQEVHGMTVTSEYLFFDTEDNNNADSVSGEYPFEGAISSTGEILINLCYYQRI